MSKAFTMEVYGTQRVMATLKALGEQATPAMRGALLEEGNLLLLDSYQLVPVDQGTLMSSATVVEDQTATVPTVLVGYGGAAAPYALAVHENPRSGRTGGISPSGLRYAHWARTGQWKYLETPFKARMAGFTARIADSLRASLLKGG